MKILVTGSNGMLGTDLCEALAAEHDVVGLDIAPGRSPIGSGRWIKADITDKERIAGIIDEERPDIVVHAAAWTDVDGCERNPEKAEAVNSGGTRNIVDAVKDKGIPLIAISTDFVFNGEGDEPYTEGDMPEPISVYGRTKYEAEKAVVSGLSDYIIIRTSWLYGKNGRNFVDTIKASAGAGEKLKVVNDQTGSPTYSRDLAGAIKELIDAGRLSGQNILNISNSGECTWHEFAKEIIADMGLAEEVTPITTAELVDRPAKRPRFSVLNINKFRKITGHDLRTWQEALMDYIKKGY